MTILLSILGLVALASGATLSLVAIDPRRPHEDEAGEAGAPTAAPAAMRRAPSTDAPGRQLVLRLHRRPDAASR